MKHDLHRRRLIAALGTASSREQAAKAVGLPSRRIINRRMIAEQITVRRVCPQGAQDFNVIEDRRPC